MSKATILVVDDQDSIRHFVSKALEDDGYTVTTTGSMREARVALGHDLPDIAILDLKLPDGTGIELLREIKRVQPEVPIILMTAFGEVETAVEAMSAGAHWFVKKPFQNDELLALVARALESQRLWLELRRLRHQAFADEDYLHSSSPSMQEAYAIAEQVSRGDNTSVLIEGESGTGKEYFANLIHRMSARHDKPFVEINCAAIPRELLENGEVLEPQHLRLTPRARPAAEGTIGQRIDDLLSGALPSGGIPFEALVEEMERSLILRASYATKWNQSRTAELLKLKRDKLRYRMKLYELQGDNGVPMPTS